MMRSKSNSLCQRSLNSPAVFINTVAECLYRHAKSISPFLHGKTLSVKSQNPIIGFVVALLFPCRPTAVAWFISLRVVNAVYRGTVRPLTHVSDKITVIVPAIAHTARDIHGVMRLFWVATLKDSLPCLISAGSRKAASFWAIASARFGMTASEGRPFYGFSFPAIALTHPKDCFAAARRCILIRYNNFAKSLTLDVFQFSHPNKYCSYHSAVVIHCKGVAWLDF